jgi:hypothetical protein
MRQYCIGVEGGAMTFVIFDCDICHNRYMIAEKLEWRKFGIIKGRRPETRNGRFADDKLICWSSIDEVK